jgi:hypothetical protein
MTTADTPARRRALALLAGGGVAWLWNGFGGYDYTMSHLQGEAYFRQMA